jgi:DNA modification methylase
MNPYYDDGRVTIYHGDCREILPTLSADAIVTDPPYGVGCDWWDDRVPHELLEVFLSRSTGPIAWFGSASQHRNDLLAFDPPPERIAIWSPKFTLTRNMSKGLAFRWHPIYLWRIPDKHEGPTWDVLTTPTSGHDWWNHPATKPLDLMAQLVGLCTAGGVVVDPFMGSGTTILAAKNRNRLAIGIEIEERYCEIAARRCSQEVLELGV